MGEQIQVIGARELRRTLRRADPLLLVELTKTHRTVAQIVTRRSAGDTPRRSGTLARTVRAGAGQRAAVVRAGFAAVPYAGVQHFGWPARNITAQPWITEAAQATESIWVDLYFHALNKTIQSIEGA